MALRTNLNRTNKPSLKANLIVIQNETDDLQSLPYQEGWDGPPIELKPGGGCILEMNTYNKLDLTTLKEEIKILESAIEGFANELEIENQTNRSIGISLKLDSTKRLILPAFEKRDISESEWRSYDYEEWERLKLVCSTRKKEEVSSNYTSLLLGGWIIYGWPLLWGIESGLETNFDELRLFSLSLSKGLIYLIFLVVLGLWAMLSPQARNVRNFFSALNLIFLSLISIGLPFLAIITLKNSEVGLFSPETWKGFEVINFVQLLVMTILIILPGLLYFQFKRREVGNLRNQMFRDIMMLNPRLRTRDEAMTLYGDKIEEASGTVGSNLAQLSLVGAGKPILLSTILISVGWIITLLKLEGDAETKMLVPNNSAISFAFLGAYYFALTLIFRRYARGDLTPKAYTHITVRILTSIILVWVISLIPISQYNTIDPTAVNSEKDISLYAGISHMKVQYDLLIDQSTDSIIQTDTIISQEDTVVQNETGSDSESTEKPENEQHWLLLVFAFVIGVFPETGLFIIINFVKTKLGLQQLFTSIKVKHPLSNLDGITTYDQVRMLEEGLDSIESLAHSDIVELHLKLRFPTSRMVDLVDQAILYLHTQGKASEESKEKSSLHKLLKSYGIRTATDFQNVTAAGENIKILSDENKDLQGRLSIVLEAMSNDQWLGYIRFWRDFDLEKPILTTPSHYYDPIPDLMKSSLTRTSTK